MFTTEALIDIHERAHRSLVKLLAHCRRLTADEFDRQLSGFGYPTVRLQLHHMIGAEEYWVGVLQGRVEADDNSDSFPTVATLEPYRAQVCAATEEYLQGASQAELNTSRRMLTWGDKEQVLIPAHVIMRTQTHIYQHQGQIVSMSRLMGKPAGGLDYAHG